MLNQATFVQLKERKLQNLSNKDLVKAQMASYEVAYLISEAKSYKSLIPSAAAMSELEEHLRVAEPLCSTSPSI